MGKEAARFEVLPQLALISREVGGRAGIKNGGWSRVVMVKNIIICVRLSVRAQKHQCKSTARVTSSGFEFVNVYIF